MHSQQTGHPAGRAPRPPIAPGYARYRGLSLVELMIVISIIVVLSVLVLMTIARVRDSARGMACLNNLHSIHTAFMQYVENNNNRFPASRNVAGRSWESLLSPYIGPQGAFRCPADSDIFPNIGSSYDWRDMPDDDSSLAGRAATGPLRQDRVLCFETLPGWHARHKIAAVRLNGKSEFLDESQCFNDLNAPVTIQNSRAK